MEARQVYLLALASKIHARGSPRWGTLCYSSGRRWPNVDGANLLSRGFISFPRKPSYSASFSPLIFLLHYLNKSLLTDSVHLSNYLDPPGLEPGTLQKVNKLLLDFLNFSCVHSFLKLVSLNLYAKEIYFRLANSALLQLFGGK